MIEVPIIQKPVMNLQSKSLDWFLYFYMIVTSDMKELRQKSVTFVKKYIQKLKANVKKLALYINIY